MLFPSGGYRRIWTLGLAVAALTGRATGGPSGSSSEDGGSVPVDGPRRDAMIEPPVDARVDARRDAGDAEVADAARPDAPPPPIDAPPPPIDAPPPPIDAPPPPIDAPPPDSGPSGNCAAQPWTSGTSYTVGAVVTADCQVSTVGTSCYGHVGALFAWRCTNATWAHLRPGSNQAGWWDAWTAVERCN